MQALS